MLSGEGNENFEKTTIGIMVNKSLNVQHTFFVHFFAVVLHDCNVKLTEISVVKSCTFYGGNVGSVLVHFFFSN